MAEVNGVPSTVRPDTPLLATGLLDSLQLMSLIEFAERRFGIRLTEEDMHPNNFETVTAVTALVTRRSVERG